MIRFYLAFYISKLMMLGLKLMGRQASYFPGKVAIKICPDFLGKVNKPKHIIGVTGTNGKTTVCNLLNEVLKMNGYKILDNKYGSNINAGIASSFIDGCNLFNKSKYSFAILEIDERSSLKIFPYVKPTYLICTNLFRDSIRRNAHAEFILDIINKKLPKKTKLILNADDLISSSLGNGNEKVFFGVDKLKTDLDESINIINDARICPNCYSKLKYNYVRYHHIGNAYCPHCKFKSPKANYRVTKIDYKNEYVIISSNGEEDKYKFVSNSIFNIYNLLAVVTLLTELGIEKEKIKTSLENVKIVESRYQKEEINDIKVVSYLAKGQNPIACSCVLDYINKEKGNKEVILLIYDEHDARDSSENITWLYDCDFEFLNSKLIDKIIIGGPRCDDFYLRLLIGGIPPEKIEKTEKVKETTKYLSLDKDVYILHDIYNEDLANEVKDEIVLKIKERSQND